MTHRHRMFWREHGTNKIYSRCYCGVDVHMDHIEDGKKGQYRDYLVSTMPAFSKRVDVHMDHIEDGKKWQYRDYLVSTMPVFSKRKEDYSATTFHPELVMDITSEKSTCDECEEVFGLQVLGDL